MQDQENEITDEVTPLDAIITGGVIVSFGLLYWLLNGSFGLDMPANATTTPSLTYTSANVDSGSLNTTSLSARVMEGGNLDHATTTHEASTTTTMAVMAAPPSPATDQAILDAIALVEDKAKRQAAATEQAETFRVTAKRAMSEQAKLVSLNTAEMAKQQSMLDKLNTRMIALEQANQSLQAELAEANKPVIEESLNEPIADIDNGDSMNHSTTSFVERFADAITQQRTNEAIIFDDVIFDSGSSRLAPPSKEQMRMVAELLKDNPEIKILIRGHTDNIGSIESNTILSITRSNSVRNELIEQGIDAERLTIEGVGLFEPIATNNTEEGRRKNRRIELRIME